jgi:hypothetical protein
VLENLEDRFGFVGVADRDRDLLGRARGRPLAGEFAEDLL